MKAILKGTQQDVEIVEEKEKGNVEVLRVSYVEGFSEGLQSKLQKVKIGFVAMKKARILTNLCKLNQRLDFKECKDVVYYVPCMKCDLRHVEEMGQHFRERRSSTKKTKSKERAPTTSMHTAEETKGISRIAAAQCLWREKGTGELGR